jgi:L-aspartate oxidase
MSAHVGGTMNGQPVIVGAGAAGLMAALWMAPRPVVVLCAGKFGTGTASGWAQGGIAAAIGADDSPALHVTDTIAAGAGLCDADAAARIIEKAPWAIDYLRQNGAKFALSANGKLELGLEAAHQRRRIVHAADATGAEVMRVLQNAVRQCPSISVVEETTVEEIAVRDGAVRGVHAISAQGRFSISTSIVILATGGIGGLFADTSNPLGALGSGLALAARAGASLRDMEFVQFHPTALACGLDPMPLISEAVRGEGAVFTDADFNPFMQGGDLAARDIVSRAVAAKIAEGIAVFLDARRVPAQKFPKMFAACRTQGIDPEKHPVPVRPAAHYHMGGIAVDANCESNIRGLFACGEVAATGLHGANRLASNSVLEAMVTGRIAAEASTGDEIMAVPPAPIQRRQDDASHLPVIRKICSEHLGISRSAQGLTSALAQLSPLTPISDAALVAWLIAHAALRRRESRGAHFRTDFAATEPAFARSSISHISEISNMSIAA